ncbi:hypothetical protein HPB51_003905 [Rhipicephalus microplus]|uniref:Uncharacterized protein n=1 Tax=Rhipicephalus microplus TaxID=6941 RepID=A0A9J6EWH9_RHIMP|nr:hypothetical protein HPB51_003905 [Rhipicephalus microplus]
MFPAIPPHPFLQCPGVPPVPWKTWRRVVQVYVDEVGPDATPDTRKPLLLNALGAEDCRHTTRLLLSRRCLTVSRLQDKVQHVTRADTMIQDQLLHGLRDPDLLRSFTQMGDTFTVQSLLEHARKQERVDRASQQLAALQVDSVTRHEHQRAAAFVLLDTYCYNVMLID